MATTTRPDWCNRVVNVNRSFGAPPPLPKRKGRKTKSMVDCHKPVSMDAPIRKLSLQRVAEAGGNGRRRVARTQSAQQKVEIDVARQSISAQRVRFDDCRWSGENKNEWPQPEMKLWESVRAACRDAGVPLTPASSHLYPAARSAWDSFGEVRETPINNRAFRKQDMPPAFYSREAAESPTRLGQAEGTSNVRKFETAEDNVRTFESKEWQLGLEADESVAHAGTQPHVFFTEPVEVEHSFQAAAAAADEPLSSTSDNYSDTFEDEVRRDSDPPPALGVCGKAS